MSTSWIPAHYFAKAFEAFFHDTKPADTWDNGKFHLSDATKCHRALWYRIMRATDPEFHVALPPQNDGPLWTRTSLDVGTACHELLQSALTFSGLCLPSEVERRVWDDTVGATGSMDAILSLERARELLLPYMADDEHRQLFLNLKGSHIVVDIKTKKDKEEVTKKYGAGKTTTYSFPSSIIKYPDAGYYTQVQCYMHLAMQCYPQEFPDVRHAIILYLCKNNGKFFAIQVDYDPTVYAKVREKAILVKQHVASKTPPPRDYPKEDGHCCGWLNNGVYEYACPHYGYCWRS